MVTNLAYCLTLIATMTNYSDLVLSYQRILLLFTCAKIGYVSVRTYLSEIEYVRYVSSSLGSGTSSQ